MAFRIDAARTRLAFLVFATAVPLAAAKAPRGVVEFRQGRTAEAMRFLPAEAEAGDRDAQTCLGTAYSLGLAKVPQDPARAAQWFLRAAAQGDSVARTELGRMHREGRGVPQDLQEARRWLSLAADQGFAPAQFELADMCSLGDGAPPDPAEAVRLYRLAARSGHAVAALRLGWAYDLGSGVPQDLSEAERWYLQAARSGNAEAQCRLGRIAESGKGRLHDPRLAAAWYRRSADQGNAEALWRLAILHRDGNGAARDSVLSAALLGLSLGASGDVHWARPTFDSLAWKLSLRQMDSSRTLAMRLASGGGSLGSKIDRHLLQSSLDSALRLPWADYRGWTGR